MLLRFIFIMPLSKSSTKWFWIRLGYRYFRDPPGFYSVLNGFESDWVTVTSGVPQDSILGPNLFLIFFNDLPEIVKTAKCLLFADDAIFFFKFCSIAACIALQLDINNILEWCSTWKISINVSKCAFIKFTLMRTETFAFVYELLNEVIPRVFVIKDLEVTFCANLSFN